MECNATVPIEKRDRIVQLLPCFFIASRVRLENFENTKNDPWDMQNNFCFHVYAQKSSVYRESSWLEHWTQVDWHGQPVHCDSSAVLCT